MDNNAATAYFFPLPHNVNNVDELIKMIAFALVRIIKSMTDGPS